MRKCMKKKKNVPSPGPIFFKKAAWLLGWFEGYTETHGDVEEKRAKKPGSRPGPGLRQGCKDAKRHIQKLCVDKWMDNSAVKEALGIPHDTQEL